jgi:D-alanyl-D-alanine dipeptidase
MSLIVKNSRDRLVFRSGRAPTACSLNGVVEQLQQQLRAAQAQNAVNCADYDKEIAALLHDLAEAKYELARRDSRDAFASAPSPSAITH